MLRGSNPQGRQASDHVVVPHYQTGRLLYVTRWLSFLNELSIYNYVSPANVTKFNCCDAAVMKLKIFQMNQQNRDLSQKTPKLFRPGRHLKSWSAPSQNLIPKPSLCGEFLNCFKKINIPKPDFWTHSILVFVPHDTVEAGTGLIFFWHNELLDSTVWWARTCM